MIEQVREIDSTIGCDTCKKIGLFFFFGGNYQQLSLNQFYAAAKNESNSFATNLPEVQVS